MRTQDLEAQLSNILEAGSLSIEDIRDMRWNMFGDAHISFTEADMLFEINDKIEDKPTLWGDLFVEAITHLLVRQSMPHGYIDQAGAVWLISRIDHDGVLETESEMELLLNIMRRADNITDDLEMYALRQVWSAVVDGRGYLSKGRKLEPGVMGQAEVELLREVLYSASSEGGIGISKREAEMIFALNDALGPDGHHESWQWLFTRAITAHLMMLTAPEEPSLDVKLAQDNWLQADVGSFMPNPNRFAEGLKLLFSKEKRPTSFNQCLTSTISAEKINMTEAMWLIERLNKDGELDTNERALLDYLKVECGDVHELLTPYLKAA